MSTKANYHIKGFLVLVFQGVCRVMQQDRCSSVYMSISLNWRALFHQKLWILSTSSRTAAQSHFSETDRRICLKVCELCHLFRGTVSLSVWVSGVMMKRAWWETVFQKIKAFSSYTSHGMWLLSKQPSCRERFERFRKTIKFYWTWGRAAKIQV